jgi:hypothetical protein
MGVWINSFYGIIIFSKKPASGTTKYIWLEKSELTVILASKKN